MESSARQFPLVTLSESVTTTGEQQRGSSSVTLSLLSSVLRRWGAVLVLSWVLVAVGFLMIVIGYLQVSAASNTRDQLSYLSSGSVGGLGVLVVAVMVRLMQVTEDRRHTAGGSQGVGDTGDVQSPAGNAGLGSVRTQAEASNSAEAVSTESPVRVRQSSTYHRPDCIFVAGKEQLESLDGIPASRRTGLRACEVCNP